MRGARSPPTPARATPTMGRGDSSGVGGMGGESESGLTCIFAGAHNSNEPLKPTVLLDGY